MYQFPVPFSPHEPMTSPTYRRRHKFKFSPQRWLKAVLNKGKKLIPSAVAILIFLVVWEVFTAVSDSTLPGPIRTVSETWELIIDPFFDHGGIDKGLFWQILTSLQRVALGFSLAVVVGVSLGVLIGTNTLMYRALDPIFQILRTIPPLAWLPISLAGFERANPSAIFVIFITAIWPIIINTTEGVRQIPQDYNNVSRVLRLDRKTYFFKILFPATVPYIFTGLKIGIGLSWLAIIAAEMLIGGVGIGFFIWDAWNSSRMSDIILAVIYVGVVGLLLDKFITFLASLVVSED
ncbi:nitrate ABC-type transport permease protein [Limnospira platensis NIES-39]|jgi:nitrate/nitrite transport system permease protein|uniref:Nitrate ABC-type transport permease protein n=2 Tax=Oscillatoriophycideae TaxID=1301283 RepID=A0A5M3T2S5_LIMPL|nr:nitrate ABC-type transport permease protein [Arthrospira platensis NIES-39]GCE92882.1 nitrate ABC-type transport permease protein [Arthrospira platensis NIES-46]